MRTYQNCCDTGQCEAGRHKELVMLNEVTDWLCDKELHGKAREFRDDIERGRHMASCPSCGRFVTVGK